MTVDWDNWEIVERYMQDLLYHLVVTLIWDLFYISPGFWLSSNFCVRTCNVLHFIWNLGYHIKCLLAESEKSIFWDFSPVWSVVVPDVSAVLIRWWVWGIYYTYYNITLDNIRWCMMGSRMPDVLGSVSVSEIFTPIICVFGSLTGTQDFLILT